MKKGKQLLFRLIFGRTMITMLIILIQLLVLLSIIRWLGNYGVWVTGSITLLSVVLIVYIINKEESPEYKISWLLPICIFPVFGSMLYLFFQTNQGYRKLKKDITALEVSSQNLLTTDKKVLHALEDTSPTFLGLSKYLESTGGFHTSCGNDLTYYPLGELKFEAMKEELKKAKDFIFLEYFIIERGHMWDSLLEILEEKAKQGVEVRVMYDGMCSLVLLPFDYPKLLQEKKIKAKMFSPIRPFLSTEQNNRDHRKILVIDGKVAFNGGVNLADEYINHTVKFGHWKDTAVMIKGDAVDALTKMFLQLWNAGEEKKEDFLPYFNRREKINTEDDFSKGYVIPYGDGPTNDRDLAKKVYQDVILTAKKYVHIMTPYFILEQDMIDSLCFAARKGVEVCILLPHIPDKKIPFSIAHTYFPRLIQEGVKMYEYTPGFVHAKTFVADDETAIVGTINLDYRSLFLHFECATLIHKNPVVADIEADFQRTLQQSMEYTLDDYMHISPLSRASGRCYRIIGPFM